MNKRRNEDIFKLHYSQGSRVVMSDHWSSNSCEITGAIIVDLNENPNEYVLRSDCGKDLVVYPYEVKLDDVKIIGVGWFTLVQMSPLNSDVKRYKAYWDAIWDENVKTSTVEDLEELLKRI